MVASMRHWAKYAGITDDEVGKQRIEVRPLGELLFGLDGIDPYMESPSSLWLIHWHLSWTCPQDDVVLGVQPFSGTFF